MAGLSPAAPPRGRAASSPGYAALAAFIALNAAVSALGGWATAASVASWYPTLAKPAFNPPNWVFAPVWTALYLMIAVAGWRAWQRSAGEARRLAFTAYGVQLGLNLSWSFVFFGARLVGPALAVVAAMLAAILVNAWLFWRIDRAAGALLVPYAAWVSFATLLNAALWRLN
jgi:tryptophan-rich sensory protein